MPGSAVIGCLNHSDQNPLHCFHKFLSLKHQEIRNEWLNCIKWNQSEKQSENFLKIGIHSMQG